MDAASAEQVIEKAVGVKRLQLDFVRGLSSKTLCTPNLAGELAAMGLFNREPLCSLFSRLAPLLSTLAGVTHLTLHCKIYCDPVPIVLPFQLRRLVIAGTYHPLALIHALFATSSTTLVDLVTNLLQGQSMEERELLYRSIGSLQRLQRLSDFGRNSDETMALLPHLPASLEEFNTCLPDRHRVVGLVAGLNLNGCVSFEGSSFSRALR